MYAKCALYEQTYRGGERRSRHTHDVAYVCLVVGGAYEDAAGRGEYPRTGGSVVIYRPDAPHASRMGPDGCRIFHVGLPPDIDVRDPTPWDVERTAPAMIRLWMEHRHRDPGFALGLETAVAEVMDLVLPRERARRAPSPRLERVRDRLTDDLAAPCSLQTLAAEVDLDPSHLARSFRGRYGVSIGEHQRQLRVARAARLLASTRDPVAGIAARLGFADQAHLTRVFKRHTGVTPARFRRLSR